MNKETVIPDPGDEFVDVLFRLDAQSELPVSLEFRCQLISVQFVFKYNDHVFFSQSLSVCRFKHPKFPF